MKNRLLLALTSLLLALSPALRAENAASHSEEKTTELGDQMSDLNAAYKKLKRQITDASKNESSLEFLAKVRTHAEAALKLKPEITAEKPAAEQAMFVEKYQGEMKKMLELVGKLETALKANQNEEAAKLIADMDAQQKSSHADFRKKKK